MTGTWRRSLALMFIGAGATVSADPIVFDQIGGDSPLQVESRDYADARFRVDTRDWDLQLSTRAGDNRGRTDANNRSDSVGQQEFLFELQFDASSRALNWTVTRNLAAEPLQRETLSLPLEGLFELDTIGIATHGSRSRVQVRDITFEDDDSIFRGMPDLNDSPGGEAPRRQSFLYLGPDVLSSGDWRVGGVMRLEPVTGRGGGNRGNGAQLGIRLGNASVPEPFTLLLLSGGLLVFRPRA